LKYSSRLFLQAFAVLAFSMTAAGCGALKKPAPPDPALVEELRTVRKAGVEAFKKGELEEAYQLTEKALELGEKHLGDFPKDMAMIHLQKALVQQARGQFGEAEVESAKAMQVFKPVPELHREYAQAVGVHGAALYKQGKNEQAIPVLKEAIQGYERSGDLYTSNGLGLLSVISNLLFKVEKFDEAGKYASQIRDICSLPSTRIPVLNRLDALTSLGQAALEQKQWKLALENYQKALEFGEKNQVNFLALVPVRGGIAKAKEMLESAPK
jgi:tetratricopeptide (TPR) repeat protein